MAIRYEDAVRTARSLLGTPYGEMDCIRLIVMIIRKSPGGDPGYRCEGTNWLWKSAENAKKYRHLTWRQEGTGGAGAGMLAFKRSGSDVHHVGLVTGEGTVIHASSARGRAVETPLDGTWDLLAAHRMIEPAQTECGGAGTGRAQSPPREKDENRRTILVRSDGVSIVLEGSWRTAQD